MDITQQYFTCKKCGESKKSSEKSRNGSLECKPCLAKYNKKRRDSRTQDEIDKSKEYSRNYAARNRQKQSAYYKKWASGNKDKIRNNRNKHRMGNPARTKFILQRYRDDVSVPYARILLKHSGFTNEQINQNPELINIQRIIIQTKRLCKT